MRHLGDLQAAQDEPLAFGNAAREIAEPQRLTAQRTMTKPSKEQLSMRENHEAAADRAEPVAQPGPRRICLILDKGNLLRWHLWLIDSLLRHYDIVVSLVAAEGAFHLPAACRVAFELERIIYRIPPGAAVDRVDADAIAAPLTLELDAARTFDVAIDCTGRGSRAAKAQRVLTVLFDGAPSEIGMLAALLDNRSICVAIEDAERPGEYATAMPALADRKVLTHAIDNACSIAIDLILKALERDPLPVARCSPRTRSEARSPGSAASLAYVASSLAWKVNRLLSFQLAGHEQWSVAYRRADGGSLITERKCEFTLLPDDGRRYFADPFVLRHRGRTALFMEEFPFDTMRGRIAVAAVEDDGTVTPPRPVLEEDHHLSYPNVFECDGEVWMIPESGANGRVDLYRAVDFPFRWRLEAALLEGVAAYDATLLRADGCWWMLAATRLRRATGWDSLSVFHAPDLRGPWRACAHNPVVLDARAARPAGAFISSLGARLRPVQDCEAFYGAAIGLWRVDRIDREGFEQTQVAEIASERFGVHTYNSAPDLEVVDVFGKTRGCHTVTLACATVRSPGSSAFPVDRDAALFGAETTSTYAASL